MKLSFRHRIIITLLLVLFHINTFAQERDDAAFTVKVVLLNPSPIINDGAIEVQIEGGTKPFKYQWSNDAIPLTSTKAIALTEGIPYTVTVSDARGC